MKTVFIHPERCIGCKQCEVACAVAHSQTKNVYLAVFERPSPKPRIHAEPGLTLNTAFPNKCRHCNPAPCQMVCPTAAIYRPADFPEIVEVNAQKCIACGMCAMVCPFGAPRFTPGEKMEKCNFCIDRVSNGFEPACVHTCTTRALDFGTIDALSRKKAKQASVKILKGLYSAAV